MDSQLTTISEELRETRAVLTRRKKMKARLQQLRKELAFYQRNLKGLRAAMLKEERDVNKLEGVSVRALFQKILGNHNQQLEIERQEYLMAALKYNEILDILNVLHYEESLLEKKIGDIPALDKKCATLFKKKSALLNHSSQPVAAQLKALDKHESVLESRRIEIDGALAAGKVVATRLRTLHNQLKSVKGWGTQELFGRGRHSSYAKKSYIDKARKTALLVKRALDKFETEVQEVFKQHHSEDRFDIGRFEKFLETFYDNLITDWIVQKSISHVLTNVQSVSGKVQRLQSMLKIEHQQIHKELRVVQRSRQKLILSC